MTPGEMTNVKKQLKQRELGGWKRIEWSLVESPQLWQLEVLQGRIVAMHPKVLHMKLCPALFIIARKLDTGVAGTGHVL